MRYMIIFHNQGRNYPIKGVPDNVPGACYRTQPKGWMDRNVLNTFQKLFAMAARIKSYIKRFIWRREGLWVRKKHIHATSPGEVIHSDAAGPTSVASLRGLMYYVSFNDAFSGCITMIPISAKSQVLERNSRTFSRGSNERMNARSKCFTQMEVVNIPLAPIF